MRRTLILALFTLACGGQTQVGLDASVDATVIDVVDASADDTADDLAPADVSTEKQWPIVYDIVDGGGDSPDCYPDGDIMQACCNGQPCRGFCVLNGDGGIECSCYGISGGCIGDYGSLPNVCCAKGRGCMDLYSCLPPQK